MITEYKVAVYYNDNNKVIYASLLNKDLKNRLTRKRKSHWSNNIHYMIIEKFDSKLKAESRAHKLTRKLK